MYFFDIGCFRKPQADFSPYQAIVPEVSFRVLISVAGDRKSAFISPVAWPPPSQANLPIFTDFSGSKMLLVLA